MNPLDQFTWMILELASFCLALLLTYPIVFVVYKVIERMKK